MRKGLFFITTVFCIQYSYSQKQPVLLTDMLKIKSVGNITVTKDGSRAAFTVQSIIPDEVNKSDYKYQTQIYTINTSGTNMAQQLTSAKEGASQPSWSQDGSKLAFVRAVDGKPQIFILSMSGGEARQLTTSKYGATNPKWSPDGLHMLFSSGISLQDNIKDSIINAAHSVPAWSNEKPGFSNNADLAINKSKANPDGNLSEIRAYLENDAIDKKAIVLNKLNFQNEFSVSSETSFSQYFIININHPELPVHLTRNFYDFSNASFTPDGKHVIFVAGVDSLASPDRSLESGIIKMDLDGKNVEILLSQKDKRYSNPSLSPSGKFMAYQFSTTSFISVPTLAIMSLDNSSKSNIEIPFDRSKGEAVWSADEKYIYITAQSNGGVPLYRINISNKKVEQLSGFNGGVTSFDFKNNILVYSKTQVSDPSEIYIADNLMKTEKQLSNFNDWVKNKSLSFPEKKTFVNAKGLTIEYWVMKPFGFQEGKKYPLLLEIHGGPSAMWGPGETSMWQEFQYFCSKGYGVVYSNPRGSGGYGLDFLAANVNDWGTGPTSDVLTALDKTVAEGWADTSKLLITGGSYAGYLTAWIIGHDHRFKAACSQRGVYDLATFFGEGNAWRLVPNYFGGYPWEPKVKEILVRESPITYVQDITTPYIIFHGGNDRRTGFVQGEMMYRSLKVLGRSVEYVVHPNATHELTRSGDNRQRLDQLLRTFEFFERYIH